jgi:hypothetical protein
MGFGFLLVSGFKAASPNKAIRLEATWAMEIGNLSLAWDFK